METRRLADDAAVVQRILDHIDNGTTDVAEGIWREPVENYRSAERLAVERDLVLRRSPVALCPAAALPETGSYLAREAAGVPLLAVRGSDRRVRVFRNACRHRGTQLADGEGCAKAFICRYHGWTYGLDGALRHLPHEEGFPDLDKSTHGLVDVHAVEAQGLVFVTQDAPEIPGAHLEDLPTLIPPDYRFVAGASAEVPANWKILVESFLEGYHIRSTHTETFYPVQFDNLNVVETFGRNNRITFPYRAIHKARALPAAERTVDGKLTYVYHLFPNVMVATFPQRIFMVALEPLSTDCTRQITYVLSNAAVDADAQAASSGGASLVERGGAEDRAVVCSIQRSLASGANEFFEFGLFEGAIGHFHRVLDAMIASAR